MILKENSALSSFIYGIRVFKRNLAVFKKTVVSSVVLNFIEPIIYLFGFGIGLGLYIQEINGMPFINYLAPGIMALSALFAATFECSYGTFVRMEHQKTFDAILATPVNKTGVVLGELFFAMFKALVFATVVMIVVYVARLISSPLLPLALIFIALGALTMASLTIMVTAVAKGMYVFNHFFTLVITPLMMLSGIYFPISGKLGALMMISPFYHTVKACQLLAVGEFTNLWVHAVALIVMSTLSCYIGIKLMSRRLSK